MWSIVFSFFFAALACWFLLILYQVNGDVPRWVPIFDLVLIVLAVFRLTRLFVYDVVTDFIRHWFSGAPRDSFLGTMFTLMNCPWCLGLWFALFVVFFYYLTPYAWFFILFLAIAGLATFVQILANLIGWQAEYRKLKTRKVEAEQRPTQRVL